VRPGLAFRSPPKGCVRSAAAPAAVERYFDWTADLIPIDREARSEVRDLAFANRDRLGLPRDVHRVRSDGESDYHSAVLPSAAGRSTRVLAPAVIRRVPTRSRVS
jgi:hypothetical protein